MSNEKWTMKLKNGQQKWSRKNSLALHLQLVGPFPLAHRHWSRHRRQHCQSDFQFLLSLLFDSQRFDVAIPISIFRDEKMRSPSAEWYLNLIEIQLNERFYIQNGMARRSLPVYLYIYIYIQYKLNYMVQTPNSVWQSGECWVSVCMNVCVDLSGDGSNRSFFLLFG